MVDDTDLDLFITISLDTLLTTTSFIHHFLLTTSPPPSTLPKTFTLYLMLLKSLKATIIATSLVAAFSPTHKMHLLTLTASLEVHLSIYTKIKTSCHWNPHTNDTSAIFPPLLHLSSLTRAAFSPTAVEELVEYYQTWIQEIIDFLPFPVARIMRDWDAYEEEIRRFTALVERGEELLGVKEVVMVQEFLSRGNGRWVRVLKEVGKRCREFDLREIEFVSALKGDGDINAGYILHDELGGEPGEEKKRVPVLLQRHPKNSSRQSGTQNIEPTGDIGLDSAIHATRSHLQHKSALSQLCAILSLLSAFPTPGIPSLASILTPLGYHHHPSTSSSYIIFRLPSSIISWDNHSFHSFHMFLNPTTTTIDDDEGNEDEKERVMIPELRARFRLGESMARIIMRLHQSGSVHGAIRSQNVIFLFSRDSGGEVMEGEKLCHMGSDGGVFDMPILMGGQAAKNLWDRVSSVGDHDVEDASITRDGDGISRRNDLHDLGVLLLELGTWTSAATILSLDADDANGTDTNANTNTTIPPPKAITTPSTQSVRQSLTNYAANTLAETMGAQYQNLVVDLLKLGFNEGNADGTGNGTGELRENEAEQWWARILGVLRFGREL